MHENGVGMEAHESAREACPPWCERTHSAVDHADDRRHQSEAEVISLNLAADRPPGSALVNLDGVVHLDRGGDDEITWVRVEGAETALLRLSMTLGSAIRLARALDAVVHRAERG
jgi:hypothetical protein